MSQDTDEASSFLFGTLDVAVLVIVLIVGIALFIKYRQKKKKESDELRSLHVSASLLGKPVHTAGEALGGNFITKMKSRNKKVIVFYGSQTGTAEEFAARLAKEASRHGLPAMIYDPEECDDWEDLAKLGDEIENSLAIFCVATYGEGDPTDNARDLQTWLVEGKTRLGSLKYTVFGLGNKTYEHFNAMGRLFDKRLQELGATRVFMAGEGDDDGNIEENFVTWKEAMWPAVCQYFGVNSSESSANAREYKLSVHTDLPPEKVFVGEANRLGAFAKQKSPFNAKNPFLATMSVNRELHKGGDRSCMHIELDITGSSLTYTAGDHVAVLPENNPELVNRIGELLNVNLDTVISLSSVDEQASKPHPFPCPTSYRTALTHYVDITSCPRTNVLKELADWASDPKEKEFLLKITSASEEGKQEYNEWIMKDKRSIVSVLEDLSSFKPPLDHLLELLPRLQARYYSISSSSKMYPSSVHITAVFVEYKTRTGRTNQGVATSWFMRLKKQMDAGNKVRIPIFMRRSNLHLPFRPVFPIIMIGPGTGVAPFRGFIQERATVLREGKTVGTSVLFFGCRHASEDFIYEEELKAFVEEKVLSELVVAFSRDQQQKVYVQHKMKEKAQLIWDLLEDQGTIYICGDARNMARDVHNVLLQIAQECGKLSAEAAQDYIKKLQKKERYLQDVWS